MAIVIVVCGTMLVTYVEREYCNKAEERALQVSLKASLVMHGDVDSCYHSLCILYSSRILGCKN